ncbi:LysM peptidoglycan-binding domain-containing protein [Stenoxybacter acetivorans]|uniref:LysM peptidoglycan-binding domain-containing protein n=1 Tax=Stenoxybacter acetivorans TaxID=422441 RepID=UPI00056D9689|nr:LysM peptidoglycan-binding domain-containing protein [Stenoxybacter acetivorans]
MQKRLSLLLCALCAALSLPAAANNSSSVRADAPTRYTVKTGDTLWGISKKFLNRPWQWPQLWNANRNEIRNPQRIYPGQVLVLNYVNGQPRLSIEGNDIPTVKLSPKIRNISEGYGISTLDVDFYSIFMKHPQFIDQAETRNAPRLVAGPDSRILYSTGDRVYADRTLVPGRYLVYRATKDLLDPDTKKYLGQEVIFGGELATLDSRNTALANRSHDDRQTLSKDEYYTQLHPLLKVPTDTAQPLMVTESVSEIVKGNYLISRDDMPANIQLMPHAPRSRIDAKIISVMDSIEEAGPYQTVTLDKGVADGVDIGTVMSVYKRSKQIKVDVPKATEVSGSRAMLKYLSIPAEEVALLMVYRTGEHLSSAVILEARANSSIGDLVSNPGYDLDNIPEQYEHAPNVPQESHDWLHNQYDMNSNINLTE